MRRFFSAKTRTPPVSLDDSPDCSRFRYRFVFTSLTLSALLVLAPTDAMHTLQPETRTDISVPSSSAIAAASPSLQTSQSTTQGTWQRLRSPSLAWFHAICFTDKQRGWIAGSNGSLLRTTDSGETWQVRPRPTTDDIHDVYFTDADTGWLLCERSIYDLKTADEPRTYVLRTTDGGTMWTRADVVGEDSDTLMMRLLFVDRASGFAFGEAGRLFVTRDGGATWRKQPLTTHRLLLGGAFLAPPPMAATANATGALQGWIVGASGTLLRTTDGGATWNESLVRDLDRPATAATATAATTTARAASPGTTMAPADSSAAKTKSSSRLRAVSFVNARRGWAVGTGGQIWATVSGGATWRKQESPVDVDLLDVAFMNEKEGWAVGTNGTVIHTFDGGNHWQEQPSGAPHRLERLSVVANRAWAVGFGGTILKYEPRATQTTPQIKRPSTS